MLDCDYLIVGAGSAGCVLADRLSRNGRYRVLALEAGGSDFHPWVKLPIGYGRLFYHPGLNWRYQTEPDPAMANRSGYWPRGKVVGGSSSINALVYCRGLPFDFDDWQAAGADGWGWEAVKPHFDCIETQVDVDGTRRGNGPLVVADVRDRVHATNRHFFEAARELGLPLTDDFNGPSPEGVGCYRITVRGRLRCSAADAFLRPALARDGVRLLKHARVCRVLFEGRRASGVEFLYRGELQRARARREVILSAGTVNSPQLLQLSGIGPGVLLQSHGVPVLLANDHVGGNLQDHLAVSYYYRATERTLNNELAPWWGKVKAGLEYVFLRRGPLGLSVNQCGGFVRSRPSAPRPDLQLYFAPITYMTTQKPGRRQIVNPDPWPGFLISFQPARPTSRGRIDIASPDPTAAPAIRPNYLATQQDLDDIVAGGRLLQAMMRTQALRKLKREAIAPDLERLDDAGLIADFRERGGSVFHPVSTCRMARQAGAGVVDAALRVFGVERLRVVDASAFPNLTSGNINAATIMLAHKAADSILAGT
ncbi:MAG: GMC family oxidoreductase [Gammaproteobacteria bacterium]